VNECKPLIIGLMMIWVFVYAGIGTQAGAYTRSRDGSTCATPGHIHELIWVIRWTEELKLS